MKKRLNMELKSRYVEKKSGTDIVEGFFQLEKVLFLTKFIICKNM